MLATDAGSIIRPSRRSILLAVNLIVGQLGRYLDAGRAGEIGPEGGQQEIVILDDRRPDHVGGLDFVLEGRISTFDRRETAVRSLLQSDDAAQNVQVRPMLVVVRLLVALLQQHAVRHRDARLTQTVGRQAIDLKCAIWYLAAFLRQ